MKILITGICGFTGFTLAKELLASQEGVELVGIDNFSREGSRGNLEEIFELGVDFYEGDIRDAMALEQLPSTDWVIDCAAEPSVLAGIEGDISSFEVMDNNLIGTIRLLEYCKANHAGFILMSTSRVYSISELASAGVERVESAYELIHEKPEIGLLREGISERFPTTPPLSLYGTSKKCSELIALEYADAFSFPVWINRCGVLAGAGQFGKADQGIFSFWIRAWQKRDPLRYIGFDGSGAQVRDVLHPRDLVPVVSSQLRGKQPVPIEDGLDARVSNFSGGISHSLSLAQLSDWCESNIGSHHVERDLTPRPFDLPWVVLNCDRAKNLWDFDPAIAPEDIFEEIARG